MTLELNSDRPKGWIGKFKSAVRNSGEINFALADQAVVSGASFVTTILLVRFLGTEEFGRFALAWLGVFLAQNLQIALIVTPMLTITAKQPKHALPAYRGAMLVQQIVFSLIMSALVFVGAKVSAAVMPDWGLGELAVPLAVLVFCGQWADFVRRYHFALERASLAFYLDALRYGVQIVLIIALVMGLLGNIAVAGVLNIMSAGALAGTVLGLAFVGRVTFDRAIITNVTRRHWLFSRWLLVTAFAQWARDNFVFTAVAALVGLTEVGALRAAQQLVMAVNVPLQGLSNIVPARASAAYTERGLSGLVHFFSTFVARYMGLIALGLAAIAVAGEWLLELVYGDAYSGYGYVTAAVAVAMLIYLVRASVSIALRAMESTTFEFYSALAGAITVAVCAYPLVSWWGLPGGLLAIGLYEAVSAAVISLGLIGASRHSQPGTGASRR